MFPLTEGVGTNLGQRSSRLQCYVTKGGLRHRARRPRNTRVEERDNERPRAVVAKRANRWR